MAGRDDMARGKPKTGFLDLLMCVLGSAFRCSLGHQTKICFAVLFVMIIGVPDVGSVGIRVVLIPGELKVEHFSHMWKNSCLHFSDKFKQLIIRCSLQGRSLNLN